MSLLLFGFGCLPAYRDCGGWGEGSISIKTMVGTDKVGMPIVDPGKISEVKPVFERLYKEANTQPIGFVKGNGKVDERPLELAANLDVMALAIAEGSANNTPQTTGEYNQNVSINTNAASQSFQSLVAAYGTPDKFMAAIGGAAEQDEIKKRQAKEAFIAYTNSINTRNRDLRQKTNRLNRDLQNYRNQIEDLHRRFKGLLSDPSQSVVPSPQYAAVVNRIQSLELKSKNLGIRIRQLGKTAAALAYSQKGFPEFIKKAQEIGSGFTKNSRIFKGANIVKHAFERFDTPLTVLSGIGNIMEVYGTSTSLGNFDPANNDLELTGNYDSFGGMAWDIGINVLGIVGNAASGNPATTAADVATFASGRFTDLYKTIQAANYSKQEAALAHKQYLLTYMKHTRQLREKRDREFDSLISSLEEELKDLRASMTRDGEFQYGDDWIDPRYDPDTGLPKPGYWAWLKKNDPGKLIALGIDPDAPVGTRPQTDGDTSSVEFDINDGRDYPTASKPSGTQPSSDDDTDLDLPPSYIDIDNDEGDDPEVLIVKKPEKDKKKKKDRKPKRPLTELEGGGVGATPGAFATFNPSTFNPDTGLDSVYDHSPVFGDWGGFDLPDFDPPKWTPPEWKPPKWTPPEFYIDDMTFENESTWLNEFPDNLAYDYDKHRLDNLSGTVAIDTSAWDAWIDEIGRRKLQRLALQAGYPNLASALTDWRTLLRQAKDSGWVRWALTPPSCAGYAGCGPQYLERFTMKRSQLKLGQLIAASRDVFSTAGLSDIKISGRVLNSIFSDYGAIDGDIVKIKISQFGSTLFTRTLTLEGPPGTRIRTGLNPGVAVVTIEALNEGAYSPNTAAVNIDNVVEGNSGQHYSLRTGEIATLRVENGR